MKLAAGETGRDGSGWDSFVQPAFRVRPYKWLAIDDYGTKWVGADMAVGSHPGLVYAGHNGTPWDETDDVSDVINVMSGGSLSDRQTALVVDHDGELWIGTPSGISVLVNPGSVVQTIGTRLSYHRCVARSVRTRDRCRCPQSEMGGYRTGSRAAVVDGLDVLGTFSTSNSPIVNDDVRTLLADQATGDVYIGTINGLSKVNTRCCCRQYHRSAVENLTAALPTVNRRRSADQYSRKCNRQGSYAVGCPGSRTRLPGWRRCILGRAGQRSPELCIPVSTLSRLRLRRAILPRWERSRSLRRDTTLIRITI